MRAGEYEVAYEASQRFKRKYSKDSTMEELLNHPQIRAFLSQMMEVDMIPDIVDKFTQPNEKEGMSDAEVVDIAFPEDG